MAFQVLSLQQVEKGGHVQMIAYSRTGTGQKFIVGRVDIDVRGKTEAELRAEVSKAVKVLYPNA